MHQLMEVVGQENLVESFGTFASDDTLLIKRTRNNNPNRLVLLQILFMKIIIKNMRYKIRITIISIFQILNFNNIFIFGQRTILVREAGFEPARGLPARS